MKAVEILEIGEKVTWMSGIVECYGLVLQDLGGKAEVMCYQLGNRKASTKLEIDKNILNKDHGVGN